MSDEASVPKQPQHPKLARISEYAYWLLLIPSILLSFFESLIILQTICFGSWGIAILARAFLKPQKKIFYYTDLFLGFMIIFSCTYFLLKDHF